MEEQTANLPVAVIGAGPIGLSAATHLLKAGLTPIILEAGEQAGTHLAEWGHIRMFSPWSYNIDPVAAELLKQQGWTEPDFNAFPRGIDLLEHYVKPLASHPAIQKHLKLNTTVKHVTRYHHDILRSIGRESAPFVVRVSSFVDEQDILVRAVIDASGTYQSPNWLGANGIPAIGEKAASNRITYGVPDIKGSERQQFSGKHTLVIGGGHSAFNALQDLVKLAEQDSHTRVLWAVRGDSVSNVVRSPVCDELQERRKLEVKIQSLLDEGKIETFTNINVDSVQLLAGKIIAQSGSTSLPPVDRIIAATGFRPDLNLLSELRTSLEPATQSPVRLAPLIDPNIHSCGSVPEHGADELGHDEPGLFIVGIKSYGRAPTFLMRTGYKQVESVVAALA